MRVYLREKRAYYEQRNRSGKHQFDEAIRYKQFARLKPIHIPSADQLWIEYNERKAQVHRERQLKDDMWRQPTPLKKRSRRVRKDDRGAPITDPFAAHEAEKKHQRDKRHRRVAEKKQAANKSIDSKSSAGGDSKVAARSKPSTATAMLGGSGGSGGSGGAATVSVSVPLRSHTVLRTAEAELIWKAVSSVVGSARHVRVLCRAHAMDSDIYFCVETKSCAPYVVVVTSGAVAGGAGESSVRVLPVSIIDRATTKPVVNASDAKIHWRGAWYVVWPPNCFCRSSACA